MTAMDRNGFIKVNIAATIDLVVDVDVDIALICLSKSSTHLT